MNFYESLGFLVFGSRLRRLSESFLADVNNVYKHHKINFDASWFPVFYILSERQTVSIKDISDELNISHSAVSQLVTSLQSKGLIKISTAKDDGRKKVLTFTSKGNQLLRQVKPIWQALQDSMEELINENKDSRKVLQAIAGVEKGLLTASLFNRIENKLKIGS
jgi:DNA-binding MarR family transcriptional regulator